MLKLKRIQILGFKSFCDRTEVVLPGQGLAAVVGPNGCGKSNILDAVSWVLGEQSAKSLRGGKMEDVIFAGSRDRKPLGMAEVSLTLIDPEVYTDDGASDREQAAEPPRTAADWDEEQRREELAAETDAIILQAQPVSGDEEQDENEGAGREHAENQAGRADGVVLKIRRRKFSRGSARAGEITVTRRLFRTGESEYLQNGKLCRLRDIQDIFMGTGLGPESYAIIEQERIGQLLSSKPHDRRAIIEEAAGITRFKTRKRLAELRLEQSRQNLARLNDIFEEVSRQVNTLRRQAAKAERYIGVRDELRGRLRVVLANKLKVFDAEGARLAAEIAELSSQVEKDAAAIAEHEAGHARAQEEGYALDARAGEASTRANAAAVELERAGSRHHANSERLAELATRTAAAAAELEAARTQLAALEAERLAHRSFLESAADEASVFRKQVDAHAAGAREAASVVAAAEARGESARRRAVQLLTQAAHASSSVTQAEESLLTLEREAARLHTEMQGARADLSALGAERGQASLQFETASESLARLEAELTALRKETEERRLAEVATRRRADALRAERATLTGRRDSLDHLLREHSYSTDTVRKLFHARGNGGVTLEAIGTLADFLEVDDQYDTAVDSFLRDELNYIVVRSWDAAEQGMRLLKTGVDGRATFLVHPPKAHSAAAQDPSETDGADASGEREMGEGVVRLKQCVRVLNGFGDSLPALLPKLRDGYVVPDAGAARALALEHPQAFFVSAAGECFHNATVTGGKARAEGPLALKRELRDAQKKLDATDSELARTETEAASLTRLLAELAKTADRASEGRRQLERESANHSAALRQMDGEVKRLEARLAGWTLETARNRDNHAVKAALIESKREESERLTAEHAAAESAGVELDAALAASRALREERQAAAAAAAAELAGLEERKRGAESAFGRIDRLFADVGRRVAQLESQIAAGADEQSQRTRENEELVARTAELTEGRAAAVRDAAEWSEHARVLRATLHQGEATLRALRVATEALREQRAALTAAAARLSAELGHLEESCNADLAVSAGELRNEGGIPLLEGEALSAEDGSCRDLKARLEAMGPVNMMALEEFQESSERHTFLEAQRADLLDSIANTQATIKEIDGISQTKFEEAFARINENFGATFSRLFNGGQASMKLTDVENSAESGIDIVASPPGKKPQNVLLLSGGEKALTALSLLVGIFQFQPSPFCVLDEVDAPLDENNVGRLAELLKGMSGETQFVMVTHSKRTMTYADLIFGVTMQEPGISKIVSVRMGNGDRTAHRMPERDVDRRALA